MRYFSRLRSVGSALTIIGLVTSGSVLAQNEQGERESNIVEEIVVSSSRIQKTTGYEAVTPETVIDISDIEARGTTNIADILNEIPSFSTSLTPTTTVISSRGNGRNGLNLRGLGENRNLVLVNGRRFVPFDERGTVDINAIPSVAIKRVDIVTGGASAAWGSDAISGVVNLIFDEDFEGARVEAQYGESSEGDNENSRVSVMFGQHFADDRGHFMIAGEFSDAGGVPERKARDWALDHWGILANPADTGPDDGIPFWRFTQDSTQFIFSPNGHTLPGGPVGNLEFFPDGTAAQRELGILGVTDQMKGGSGAHMIDRTALSVPLERNNFYSTFGYDINKNVRFFAEASYSRAESLGGLLDAFAPANFIDSGNPYIPADVQATMTANAVPFLVVFKTFEEFDPVSSDSENTNQRIVAGFDGNFGANDKWWFDGYVQYGENQFDQAYLNNWLPGNIRAATSVVSDPISGQPVCAANAGGANGAPGCEPLNLFGSGSASQAAIDYITQTPGWSKTTNEQTVFALTVGGDIAEGWAGPISAAFGAEYRDESLKRQVDARSENSEWAIINPQPLSGSYDATEIFAEFNLPLIASAQSLDLSAAVRWADYSTVGSATSWKGGLVYKPIESLLFRAGVSQDIRAPSIGETFLKSEQLVGSIFNPFTGRGDSPTAFRQGNESLSQEEAITQTIGFVWSPESVDLRLSIDWYNIEIDNAIGSVSLQNTVDGCFDGIQVFCDVIVFDAMDNVVEMTDGLLNIGLSDYEGLDISADYNVDVGPGTLGFNLTANNRLKQEGATVGGGPGIDTVGEHGGQNGLGAPEWQGNFNATYDLQNWGVFAQLRYIHSGVYNITWGPEQLSDAQNNIDAVTYVNLSAYYNLNIAGVESAQLYLGVNNLSDKEPPISPLRFFNHLTTNAGLYDVIGRQWFAGVRVQF
jgi:iron complex outermembrane receptor protein|tara:strand:- start:10636 stop:13416 length:2781 start_codon:yes stop_codon:yes gene_type:complete